MASSVFLDTQGWLALLNSADGLHANADRVWRDLGGRGYQVVLTDWVVAETGNGLARSQIKNRFAEAVQLIDRSVRSELIFVNQALLRRALEMYERHQDKSWGLVDCASFIVMADASITEAFTSDRHFEQAGYRCLLPTS